MDESIALTTTLNQLSELDKYNTWIFERIKPGLGHSILEIGAGIGNFTQLLSQHGREVTATDIVPNYCKTLSEKFGNHPAVKIDTFDLNIKAPINFIEKPFDTIVCLNVLEHIKDDKFALEQMYRSLESGGKLCLLVPSHQFLYGKFDEAVGHYRRYEKSQLKRLLKQAGFKICSIEFFNIAAIIPWLINGRILKRDYIPANQSNIANMIVPLLKLEKLFGPPFGISLIAIAEK